MKHKWSKGLAAVLGVAMLMGAVGCGGKQTTETTGKEATNKAATNKASSEVAAKDEVVTLNFWHIWGSETDSSYKSVIKVIEDFEREYPNIKIKVDTTENEAYKTKIKAAAAANELPDIFSTWGGGFSKAFVDAGRVLALDEYLNDGTRDKMIPAALDNVTYDGKAYGMTFGLSCGAMFVNTELFEKHNVKIPETYDELVTAVKAFRALDMTPITVSGKDAWTIAMFFDALAIKDAGAKLSQDALYKKASFKEPEFVDAATKFAELVALGAFPSGAAGLSKDESDIPFLEGQIPMVVNGSWTAGVVYRDDSKIKDKIKAIGFPVIPGAKGSKSELTGGAADAIMLNAETKHKEEAVLFQKYFCENMARETYLAGAYLPAWKIEGLDESNINPLTRELAQLAGTADSFTLWWNTILEGADMENYHEALQELLLGGVTPEEFTDKLQTMNE